MSGDWDDAVRLLPIGERPAVTASDVSDDNPRMIAGQLRALQRDVNAGFESIAQALKAFERIESRLDVIIDRQNETDRRIRDHERRLAALETRRKPRKK